MGEGTEESSEMGDVTFSAGGAIPTTIKAIGDPRELETAMRLKKTQLRAMGLNMSHEPEGESIEESEKLAQAASDRARKLGAQRRRKQGSNRGMYKSERAGYNLAQSQRSQNVSPETQRGNQTGGGPKPFGFARNKSNPIKSKTYAGSGNKAKRRMDAMKSEAYTVNQADKTGNTPAYQGYKAGKKNKLTGEPLYKKGNMKENLVTIEKFNNVANINVNPSNYNSEKDLINDILKKNSELNELNRFEKEKGTDTKTGKPVVKGGTAKKDLAFQAVMKKYGNQRMGGNEPKKVKGAKSDEGTGRITKMLAKKKDQQAKSKALDAKAKKAGYKSTQDYVNVQAVRKGGLGT
tara:strand:- start:358 stop:1404 length:1047 start_codon:yes stop_codon:yes gene_type:complete